MLNLYPSHIIFDKVINQITHRKNKLWQFLPVSRISASGIGTIPDKTIFRKQVLGILGDLSGVISQIKEEEKCTIIKAANQTIKHQFNYLGSGEVQMPKIRWHDDFKSGATWKKGVFYLKQRGFTTKGADIKVPWELSRGHHLLWLGEAYLITKDEKYAEEVIAEIEDWWDENPFMYSVNWTCTMDVAIRAVNWLYAVCMVLESSILVDSFIEKFYRSLYQHGWFIFNNLERTVPYSNNHLFSNLAALIYLSLLYKDTKRGRQWYDYTVFALYEEIRCQVLPSGVHYERSVSYHRLMTEMVLAPLFVLKRCGVSTPADIEYRTGSMLSYICSYTKQNHKSPLFEDNDDGRFLPFVRRDFREHDYLIDGSSAEVLFITNGVKPIQIIEEKKSMIFPDAGHAILRKGEIYLFVTNGEQSCYYNGRKTVGTHTHNDKLSFEFALGDDDIIIDPGAYIYTPQPSKSNEFRSTLKHNTVVVDDEEQNVITPKNVFLATKNSLASLFQMLSATSLEGEYFTFKGKLTHKRRFDLEEDSLVITDELYKDGPNHTTVISLHLAPHLICKVDGKKVIAETETYYVSFLFEENLEVEIVNDTVSPSYGVLVDSKTIRARLTFGESVIFKTRIQWSNKQLK